MRKNIASLILLLISILVFNGCSQNDSKTNDRIVIGIASDVTTFNPLFTFNMSEGNITELIYLSLVGHGWDDEKGDLTSFPLLAESWTWKDNSSSLIFKLRDDIFWSDSIKFTSADVVFSFDLYSDPLVQSRFYGSFENYFTNPDLSINLEKSFEVISDYEIKFNFKPGSVPTLFDTDMPILPKHIFENHNRENLATADESFLPVGTGPYGFSSWNKNQTVILKLDERSPFAKEKSVAEIIFKIIPDYNARITQLKNQEIDLIEDVRSEDLNELKGISHLKYALRKGRDYDYVGWNNIDPVAFAEEQKIVPNLLFGSSIVRRALTHAINRQMILEQFLGNYGQLVISPIAPIFKWAIDNNLSPYNYEPEIAVKLLESEGWIDSDNDGIREKNGVEFSFDLNVPGGNPRRINTATVIQDNLKAVGIDVNIVTLEPSVLANSMFQKKFDAWISGWSVPIPIMLKPFWHSDLETNALNVASYMNKDVDKLLERIEAKNDKEDLTNLYKKFQESIHNDEPVTFLFWIDNIVVYNSKMNNMEINPLGSIHYCWNWTVEE